jgi:glucose-6-phosphate dehydrogenase assembly protein OpcA
MDPLGRRGVPSPADVEEQLAEFLREASTDEQAVMRACAMNLVVICADETDDLRRATELVAGIAATAPGRALVVSPPGGDAAELAVYVSAHCHRGAGGAQVCSEQVTIEPGTSSLDLVPGTVLQLLVEDMPVYTWWRRRELDASGLLDPLVDLSDYWIVDSATSGAGGAHLQALLALSLRGSWEGHVIDAAWARLAPWREALASFFDDPALRPALDRITRVEVEAGGRIAQAYLSGWLASRLGFRHDTDGRWFRPDGVNVEFVFRPVRGLASDEVAAARIEAEQDDTTVIFTAGPVDERKECLSLTVTGEGRAMARHKIRMPSLDETGMICGLLQRTGRDTVFEEALALAVQLVLEG